MNGAFNKSQKGALKLPYRNLTKGVHMASLRIDFLGILA